LESHLERFRIRSDLQLTETASREQGGVIVWTVVQRASGVGAERGISVRVCTLAGVRLMVHWSTEFIGHQWLRSWPSLNLSSLVSDCHFQESRSAILATITLPRCWPGHVRSSHLHATALANGGLVVACTTRLRSACESSQSRPRAPYGGLSRDKRWGVSLDPGGRSAIPRVVSPEECSRSRRVIP
jgi:hypothetical protein